MSYTQTDRGWSMSDTEASLMETLRVHVQNSRMDTMLVWVGIFKDSWYEQFGEEVPERVQDTVALMCGARAKELGKQVFE